MPKLFVRSLLFTSISSIVHAADQPLALPEMVVTATRSETASNKLAAGVSVYTREDIERKQVKTLPDLLKGTAGLDVIQNGGYGNISTVFMRGSNSNQLLVLIDGIRAGSVTAGLTSFATLPIDQIERVEITRGPGSSLYGSEAIGGVIQIFTRKDSKHKDPHVSVTAGGGSYDTANVAGNVSGNWQDTWYNLGVSHFVSEGINARRPIPGAFGFSQPDRDGYQNTGINARVGHKFSNQAEIEAFFMRGEGDNEYDSDYGGDHNAFLNQTVGIKGSLYLLDNWKSSLNLGQSRDDYSSYCPESPSSNNFICQGKANGFDSNFDSTRWSASWVNELQINEKHKTTFGADYRVDQAESNTLYSKNPDSASDIPGGNNEVSRYDVGVFGELQSQVLDNHYLNASVRWDHVETTGDYVSSNVGWRYQWQHGLSAFASFGNSFKAPTFNELYYPQFGNINLKAEEGTEFEVGIAGQHAIANWEIRAYHKNIENLIIAVPDPRPYDPYKFKAENVNKAQVDGIESSLGTNWLGWHAQLNMTIMGPVDRTTNARLPRRADKSLSFDLSRSFDKLDVGLFVLAQSNRFDSPGNKKPVAGYVTADLRSTYHISPNWSVSAKLNNILDKDYQTVDTYNTMGRNFFFTVQYNN